MPFQFFIDFLASTTKKNVCGVLDLLKKHWKQIPLPRSMQVFKNTTLSNQPGYGLLQPNSPWFHRKVPSVEQEVKCFLELQPRN